MKVLSFLFAVMLVFSLVGVASSNTHDAPYGPLYDSDSECPYYDCQVAAVDENTVWVEGIEGKDIIGQGKYIFPLPKCEATCEEEEVVVVAAVDPVLKPVTFVVHFDFDKSDIRADQLQILEDAFAYAEEGGAAVIRLASYCDFRGSGDYNVGLGGRRVNAVKSWLDDKGLTGVAYTLENNGKFKSLVRALLSGGFCQECWTDRRVEITVK